MIRIIILSVFAFLLASCQSSAPVGSVLPEYQFEPDQDYLASIQKAQNEAQQQNKLLLLVLGASWCHDSQDLAKGFSRSEVDEILKAKFVTHFIDVGYFEDKHGVPQKYGYPGYFATPTVLIIDPHTNQLVNRASITKWQHASQQKPQDFIQYFNQPFSTPPQPLVSSIELEHFTHIQMQRLKQAFDHLREEWRLVRAGEKQDVTELQTISEEVWQFRVNLQKHLHSLQNQLNAEPNKSLTFPEFAEFSWKS
ncbi:thioredoxin family protein [Paraglaciecola aestuariivivens]